MWNEWKWKLSVLGFAVLALVGAPMAQAQIGVGVVHISPTQGVDSPGRSGNASEPFASITFALSLLESEGIARPWVIRLKQGTYSAASETFPIPLHTGMQLIGEDGPEQVVITGSGNANKNTALVFANGATNVTISGITFRDQQRTGGSNLGGAMELVGFGGSIENCRFIENSTRLAGGAIWVSLAANADLPFGNVLFEGNKVMDSTVTLLSGGAVHVSGDYRGVMTDTAFTGNAVRHQTSNTYDQLLAAGGALFVSGNISDGNFQNCTFESNLAKPRDGWEFGNLGAGGAIYVGGAATTDFESCVFQDNQALGYASRGGSIFVAGNFQSPGAIGFQGTAFTDNLARTSGGALFVGGNATTSFEDCTLTNNQSRGNAPNELIAGGAIHIAGALDGSITGCEFRGNAARNLNSGTHANLCAAGGALFVGTNLTSGSIVDCIFESNIAKPREDWDFGNLGAGGAVYIAGNASALFQQCEFSGNVAYGYYSNGGAIAVFGNFNVGSDAVLASCSLFENGASGPGGAFFVRGSLTGSILDSNFIRNFGQGKGYLDTQQAFGGAVGVAGGMQGDVAHNLFSDNQIKRGEQRIKSIGGALGINGTYSGHIEHNTFTANQVVENSNSWGEGGAIGILNRVQLEATIRNNVFSKNSATYGGGIYLRADNATAAVLYNNHFLYNQTPGSPWGGTAIFTRQNALIFNNTIWGAAANASAIALWDQTGASQIRNNIIGNIHTAIHMNSTVLANAATIRNNNFRNTTNIVARGETGLGNNMTSIAAVLGDRFSTNYTHNPLLVGEREASAIESGSWRNAAYYDSSRGITVFSDPTRNWLPGRWTGAMLNLSQNANDRNQREHYLISGNTATEIHVIGNLVPAVSGITQLNRGLNGHIYTIDDYRLTALSPNIDRGSSVERFIGDTLEDITPTTDYEGEVRPRNCRVDIGADESIAPTPASFELVGASSLCLALGEAFVEPGVIALDTLGRDIGTLARVQGTVNTNVAGTYVRTYTLDTCDGPVFTRTRTIVVSSTGCQGPTPPIANAGPDQVLTLAVGASTIRVRLDGRASSSSVGIQSFIWTGLGSAPDPQDEASPEVVLGVGTFEFRLTVTDTVGQTDQDTVSITVRANSGGDTPPVADPGPDQTIEITPGQPTVRVRLTATGSSAAPGTTIVRYVWRGLNGAPDPDDVERPELDLGPGTYRFELTVTDSRGNTATSVVVITIKGETPKTGLFGCSEGVGTGGYNTGDLTLALLLMLFLACARVRTPRAARQ